MNENERIYRIIVSADNGKELSPEEYKILEDRRTINWSFSLIVKNIPKHIYLLHNLEYLDLSGLELSFLPNEICSLSSLQTLILRGNRLTSLPDGFCNLKNIERLDLSRNIWEAFPIQIKELKKITYLNIGYCSFSNIPGWLLDFNLSFIFEESNAGIIMEKTDAPEIPIFLQPRSTIIKYYTQLRDNGLIVREAKVVFLGKALAGKTYTIDRIMNDNKKLDVRHKPDETKGISITHKDFYYESRSITINFWDFGGQQILYAMHRCFLTVNTLYVIVLSGREEEFEQSLQDWMTTLKTFVSDNCPVVVLQNLHAVRNEVTIDRAKIRRKYKNIIDVMEVNVKTASDSDFEGFVNTIIKEAIEHTRYGVSIPRHWANVKKELEQSREPFLTKEQFTDLLERQSQETPRDELEILDWLNEIGTSFSCHRASAIMLHEYVVLNPEWATNAVYAIITSERLSSNDTGILELGQIYNILKNTHFVNDGKDVNKTYGPANIEYVLQLMENYLLSFRINGENKEFIPALCKNKEPICVEEYIKCADLHFEIHYNQLPSNLLHRFMIDDYSDLLKGNKWWYSGGLFISESYQCYALIFREFTHNEDPRISIYIRNCSNNIYKDESWRYLQYIRRKIENISKQMHIKPKGRFIIYSEPNMSLSERISIEDINKHISLGWSDYRSTVFDKSIPITDIFRKITPVYDVATSKDLLTKIIAGCSYMQKRSWLPNKENIRNDYLCDILRSAEVAVMDQTRSGKANNDAGELDFLFVDSSTLQEIAIMEALNLSSVDKEYVKEHINKLVSDEKYNPNGLNELYMLVYANVNDFSGFCNRYYEYVKEEIYPYSVQSIGKVDSLRLNRQHNIKIWKVVFNNNIVLHHIIVKFANN